MQVEQQEPQRQVVRFHQWTCRLVRNLYHQGRRLRLDLVDVVDGEPVACATVNVPWLDLAEDEVVVKDYAENSGMLDALTRAGVVAPTGRYAQTGHIQSPICRLLPPPGGV